MKKSYAYERSMDLLTLPQDTLHSESADEIAELLEYHAMLYYNRNESIISDTEYDRLLKLLESLEEKYSITDKKSQRV